MMESTTSPSPSPSPSPTLDPLGVSVDLAPLPTLKAKGDSNFDFDGYLSKPLKLHEDVRNGNGGQAWPAGRVLGKHLLRYHQEELQSARVLELGAGGGLVGLGVAKACGAQGKVLLTDQVGMIELMKHNIELNEVQANADALVLNWGEQLPQEVIDQKPNIIIAAELVYFEPAFPLLLQTLKDLLVLNESAVVYFSFKKRRRADLQFVKMAKKAFLVEEIFDEDRPAFQRENLFLFKMAAKGSKQGNTQKNSQNQQE